jgi:Flp pilus assembly protein TadG
MFKNTRMKLAKRARRLLKMRGVRGFARRQDGAAAVEFGLVVLPFLALMFAIIETALVFFAQQSLETIAANTARQILTGQAQTTGYSLNTFTRMICNQFVVAMFSCPTGMYVDVKTYSSFSSINNALPLKNDGTIDSSNFVYQPGNPGDIVVVRLMYQWPIFVNLLGDSVANMANNSRLLVATAAFRNEPY